jgi:hypothetical protein
MGGEPWVKFAINGVFGRQIDFGGLHFVVALHRRPAAS